MLYYNPQQYHAHLQEDKLYYYSIWYRHSLQSALNRHTLRLLTEGDDTRGCNNTICPPKDEQGTARKTLRIIM